MLSKKMRVSSVDRDRSFGRGVSSRVPKERKRFTPWLEEQIDEGGIDGLEWIEKDKGIFKVPWVRVDKPEFVLETHAELFKRWAQHTGKYRQGDQPDPSTWKTRFRCALRKMQEIVEIKELGSLEGSRPYRAFKFEPKLKERTSFKRSPGKGRRRSSLDSLESSDNSPMDPNSVMGGSGDAWEVMNVPNGRMNQFQFYDEYAPGLSYGLRGQETNNFDSLQNNWIASSCLMQEGFNGAIYNEHIPLHQLVDLRDFAEPVKPEDLDRYFPDGIWNQYSLSGGSNYGMREQESNYGPTILREGLFTVFN